MVKKIDRLSDYNIVSKNTKTEKIFLEIEKHFMKNPDAPAEYVKKMWERYKALPKKKQSNSMNGSIFEAIVITSLLKEGITPIYTQTALAFVPNVDYDIVVFPKGKDGRVDVSAPVVLSLKTSLRERYKQADLEALALKDVYKRGTTYLITLEDLYSIDFVNEKIQNKDIRGIDGFINATSEDYNYLVNELSTKSVSEPPPIEVIRETTTIK